MMTLVTLSHHLGLMWVAMEATTLVSAPSIYFNHNARSLEATWKYLLVGSVGIALALLGSFFLVQRPGRQLQEILNGRMTILPNESNGAVVERRQDDSAPRMMHDFANVSPIVLANRINGDVKDTSLENCFRVNVLRCGLCHAGSLICGIYIGNGARVKASCTAPTK